LIPQFHEILANTYRIHLVNIVTLADGSKYHVDVGFGGDQATKPLPLVSGHSTPNIGTQEIRLVLSNIPQQLDQSQKLWIYEYRNNPEQQWNSFYCFPDTEFLETDFVGVNHFTSTYQGPLNFQTRTVIIVRFLREGEDIVGKIICINDEIKRNMGGKTSLVKICKTEDERVETFKSLFGIDLTEEEREGIKGRNVELLGTKKE
jgi:arylamine N-acetyltransferase